MKLVLILLAAVVACSHAEPDLQERAVDLQALSDFLGVDFSKLDLSKVDFSKIAAKFDPRKLAAKLNIDLSKLDLSKVDLTKLDISKLKDLVSTLKNHVTSLLPTHCKEDTDCGAGYCCAHLDTSPYDKRGLIDDLVANGKEYINNAINNGKDFIGKGKDAISKAYAEALKHGVCEKVVGDGEKCALYKTCGCAAGLKCNQTKLALDIFHVHLFGTCGAPPA